MTATGFVVMVEDVSVRYRVAFEPVTSLKEHAIRRLQGRTGMHDHWAVRDVSFSTGPGEALGIVGRNGAGKSTLLKVIARVLRPTTGRVRVIGRIVPLIEIGAGFHPELTARENVYLNAALLGHGRREVDDRFDDIVAFAELGDFIDAPLRTFSTGMVVRLGFSVATAWEPDLLLIDEVLAVGDEAFQRKCQARMRAFREAGAAILLVSHNAAQVQAICSSALWLERGQVRAVGETGDVIRMYQSQA